MSTDAARVRRARRRRRHDPTERRRAYAWRRDRRSSNLALIVAGTLTIDATGRIDVGARGFLGGGAIPGLDDRADARCGSQRRRRRLPGGLGAAGNVAATAAAPYGDFRNPNERAARRLRTAVRQRRPDAHRGGCAGVGIAADGGGLSIAAGGSGVACGDIGTLSEAAARERRPG